MWYTHHWMCVSWFLVLHIFCKWTQANAFACQDFPCAEPYTQTPVGSPCGCVLPMQIEIELNVTLEALFPQFSILTEEIANGLLLLSSQVRVVAAAARGHVLGRSSATIDLVPLGKSFDNLTAQMLLERLRYHQVLNNTPFFSNYTLVYVHYPGLIYSSTTDSSNDTSKELPGAGILPHEQPLSVDVSRSSKRFGGSTLVLILLSSAIAAIGCGVLLLLVLRFSKLLATFRGMGKSRSFLDNANRIPSFSVLDMATLRVRMFSFYDLERATNNFNSNNILGQGGYGFVFAGTLNDGTEVAVKLMTQDDHHKRNEFFAELEMLSREHHRNLVKLIGACLEENKCCLVYEFVSNGNVESHLHGGRKLIQPLDWNARMKIALGAARGLAYLHEDANPHVIHRDFKASNILLDKDFTPKISDFGLAKVAPDQKDVHISTVVMGTFGYVAPEYAMTGHLLVKSDVYSFGVVLLELLSGKPPIDLAQPSGKENLVSWARPLLSSEEGLECLADPCLEGRYPPEVFSKVAAIASMCVQPDVSLRPFMGEVVQALKAVSCASEGVSSCSVSPQASGGAQSDVAGQASDSKSGPLIDIDCSSPMSVDFGFNTAHRTIKEAQESSSVGFSDSGYIHPHASDLSERHSLSGPSSSNRVFYAWSLERDNSFAPSSEHSVFGNTEKRGYSSSSGTIYAWSTERHNLSAPNSEHITFRDKEKSAVAEACGSWP